MKYAIIRVGEPYGPNSGYRIGNRRGGSHFFQLRFSVGWDGVHSHGGSDRHCHPRHGEGRGKNPGVNQEIEPSAHVRAGGLVVFI